MNAQLYSSGNNSISGNKVGIGVNNPFGSVQIKDYSGIAMNGGMDYIPLIRFQSADVTMTPIITNYWDFRMDWSSSLTFWHHTTQNTTPVEALRLGSNYVKIFQRFKVGDYAEFGTALTPDNTQGYALSMGLKEVSTAAWQGQGAIMFTTSTGDFQLITHHNTSVINGATSMLNNLRFSINETNAYFSTPVRIGGGYGDVNILASPYKLFVE